MPEPDGAIDPVMDSVRSAVRDGARHPLKQEWVDGTTIWGTTIEVVEAGDSAHRAIILLPAG